MKFHPNANKALVRYARKVHRETGTWNYREIARRLDVNVKYVWQNLTQGIEPPMENTDVRKKLFMRTNEKRARSPYAIMPHWWTRTPETLAYYLKMKANVKRMVDDTRAEQFKHRRKRSM